MTKEKYLEMCEALGDEPDPEKIPPDIIDFPDYIHEAFNIFNSLPDRFTNPDGGMLYIGKDLGPLESLFNIFQIDKDDRLLIFEAIQLMDKQAKDKAHNEFKQKAKKGR